jgi:alpha-D-ribose 1-methylphosphonate 5-triphosphate synthase subunit PhnH
MHPLNIWYLNEKDSQEAGVVSTLSLNKQFQLVQCGSATEPAKSQILLIKISDVEARFVSMFDPLAVRNLRALVVCHHCQ